MELNQNEVEKVEQVGISIPTSVGGLKKSLKSLIISIAIVVLCVGGILSYIYAYVPYREKQKQELIKQLEFQKYQEVSSRISKGDIVSLTKEDYSTYLRPGWFWQPLLQYRYMLMVGWG